MSENIVVRGIKILHSKFQQKNAKMLLVHLQFHIDVNFNHVPFSAALAICIPPYSLTYDWSMQFLLWATTKLHIWVSIAYIKCADCILQMLLVYIHDWLIKNEPGRAIFGSAFIDKSIALLSNVHPRWKWAKFVPDKRDKNSEILATRQHLFCGCLWWRNRLASHRHGHGKYITQFSCCV